MSIQLFKKAVDSGDTLGAIFSLETYLYPNKMYNQLGRKNALVYAFTNEMGCLVPAMLERRFSPNAICEQGKTALHFAIESVPCDLGLVKLLLDAGALVNLADDDEWTPLHYASRWDDVEVAKLLLGRGADVSLLDTIGHAPVHIVARYGNVNMLQILLDAGSDPDVRDESAKTPLVLAVRWGHVGAVKLLLKRGANTDARDNNNRTALHYLGNHRDHPTTREITLALLEAGASVLMRDKNNHTPLETARYQQRTELAKILEEFSSLELTIGD